VFGSTDVAANTTLANDINITTNNIVAKIFDTFFIIFIPPFIIFYINFSFEKTLKTYLTILYTIPAIVDAPNTNTAPII